MLWPLIGQLASTGSLIGQVWPGRCCLHQPWGTGGDKWWEEQQKGQHEGWGEAAWVTPQQVPPQDQGQSHIDQLASLGADVGSNALVILDQWGIQLKPINQSEAIAFWPKFKLKFGPNDRISPPLGEHKESNKLALCEHSEHLNQIKAFEYWVLFCS